MNWKRQRNSELNEPITQVLDRMAVADPEEEHYARLCSRLETLIQLRDGEKRSWMNNPATITVIGNVFITGMVIAYEKHGVMTSKARDWHSATKTG